jgi:hypothetical protein
LQPAGGKDLKFATFASQAGTRASARKGKVIDAAIKGQRVIAM